MSSQRKSIKPSGRLALLTLFTLLASGIQSGAQTASQGKASRPRILLAVTIEGLSTDYLSILKDNFGEGGFKRLMNDAVEFSTLDYGPGLDATAAMAVLYTGASPVVNGIPSAYIYDPEKHTSTSVLTDTSVMGNFTDETYSPAALKVSTLADEIRVDSDGDGFVYSIAAAPSSSIISAGHAANSAFWLNRATGNWATSTYYKDVPPEVTEINYRDPLSDRLTTYKWTPKLQMNQYPLLSMDKRVRPFSYTYPASDMRRYERYATSPGANDEVTIIATRLLKKIQPVTPDAVSMLNVAYSLAPDLPNTPGRRRAEIMDAYVRLDESLASLIQAVEKQFGQDNVAVMVAGLPGAFRDGPDDPKWRIPYGQFSIKRANALLNMYLMSKHGNGQWIDGYHNRHFYLNQKLAAEKNVDLPALRAEAADFLGRMAGISNVYPIESITAARVGADPEALKRNTSLMHSGDVVIEVNPGWEIVDDPNASRPGEVMRHAQIPAPLFIMAPGIAPEDISTPLDAREVAPTLARILRIRSPNGAALPALDLGKKK